MAEPISDTVLARALGRIWADGAAGTGAAGLQRMLKTEVGQKIALARISKWLKTRETGSRMQRVHLRLADSLRSFDVRKPNQLHHADTLVMPTDRGSSSMLVVRDAASRYTDAEPLPDKTAREAVVALEKIYSRNPRRLKPPTQLNVDKGTEFAGDFADWLKQNLRKTRLSVAKDTNDHRHASLAEAANHTIAKRLFAYQHEAEHERGGVNRQWVQRLRTVLNRMNRTVSENLDDKTPEEVLTKNVTVTPRKLSKAAKRYIAEDRNKAPLKEGTLVRVPLFKPADGGRWRATDLRLSEPKKITEVFAPISHPDAAFSTWEYRVEGSKRLWTRGHLTVAE